MSQFFYCTKTEEREGFNMMFWTIPFDLLSWIMIIVSGLSYAVFLKVNLFDIFAILMRQECRIMKDLRIFAVIYILSSIIFTYGYEGVISSLVIVKPPVIIHDRLKDMLANHDFKILYPQLSSTSPVTDVFESEKIVGNITDYLLPTPYNRVDRIRYVTSQLANCNTTTNFEFGNGLFLKMQMKDTFPHLSCNVVKSLLLQRMKFFCSLDPSIVYSPLQHK